jgi:hypothetical protein
MSQNKIETKISPMQKQHYRNGITYGVHFGFIKVFCLSACVSCEEEILPPQDHKTLHTALIKASNPCQSTRFLRDMDKLEQFT